MHRQGISVTLITLVLAYSAGAFVGQEQGFCIGAANFMEWPGGVGFVEGGHQAVFSQAQTTFSGSGWSAVSGFQNEMGVFNQYATTGGDGPATVGQTANIVGNQQQGTGTWGQPTTSQGQQMGVNFTTSIVKPWGAGTANASQSFFGGQTQALTSPGTSGTQSQFVGVTEYANVVGGTIVDPSVNNSISIGLSQNQQATATVTCPLPCKP